MRTVGDINGVLEQKIMGWGIAGQGESSLYKRYIRANQRRSISGL